MRLKLRFVRRYNHALRRIPGIFYKNPVLSLGLAMPFAVVCTTRLQYAAALSIAMFLTLIPTLLLASLVGERLISGLRVIVYPLVASVLLVPVTYLIEPLAPNLVESLGFYLQILPVNTLLIFSIGPCVAMKNHKKVLTYAVLDALGFALALCILGFIRELLGSGTVWGAPLSILPGQFRGVSFPFFGFIALGLLAAGARSLNRLMTSVLISVEEIRIQRRQEFL